MTAFRVRLVYLTWLLALLVIDAFGAQLRDDVDLRALQGRLVRVASEVVQATDAGLWIRGRAR